MAQQKSSTNNRLPKNFDEFASNFELPHKIDSDGSGAKLGIPESGKLIQARYFFDSSDDNYEWAAVIGEVREEDKSQVALDIIESTPKRGIIERILSDKLVIFGSRDNLCGRTDDDIQAGFQDDVSRISRYHRENNNRRK
jgi:hypothetical protein